MKHEIKNMYVMPNRDEIREWQNPVMVAHAVLYLCSDVSCTG